LNIILRIELPPDNRSDEISVQILYCSNCEFKGLGIYEESRRGSMLRESINHRGIYLPKDLLETIHGKIQCCPEPHNPHCLCDSHNYFKIVDNYRWNWLNTLNQCGVFEISLRS
jgi:hypothetical protein